ncbi:hypothetical protein MMC07_006941 [Pseudocyphellaria aurata]|nr:hypothetical protein [Pseudocyphellaria aurata]
MDIRSNESPMDFQWQKGHGPAGQDSPFLKAAANHHQNQSGFTGQKLPYNQNQSPTKPSQPFHFTSTPSMRPPFDSHKSSFTTPQKSIELDCSSGPENQSSPLNADNEDTPELPQRSNVFKNAGSMVPFPGYKSEKKVNAYPSSGRGEISRKSHHDALPRRVQKRRRLHGERDVRLIRHQAANYDSDSDSRSRPSSRDGGTSSRRQSPNSQPSEIGTIPAIFHFIEKHPNLPHILSYYAQFLLNLFFVMCLMYLVYLFFSTIRSDVDIKSRDVVSETVAEIATCAREFKDNRCDRSSRVPAMEIVCDNWEKCMNRDPSQVGRARVSAETFAGILSNFIDNLSVKTMIVTVISILGVFTISNSTLMYFRHKIPTPDPPPPPPSSAPGAYNMQPYLHPHPQQLYPGYFYPPFQTHMQGIISPGSRPDDDDGRGGLSEKRSLGPETPSRRIGYR